MLVDDDTKIDDATAAEESQQEKVPLKHLVDFTLCGFDGAPIDGLKCRIKIGGKTHNLVTSGDGKIPELPHQPGDPIKFSVMRDDGTYKKIGESVTDAGENNYTLISPAFVVETKTELHEGEPGKAEENIPKPDPTPAIVDAQTEETAPVTIPATTSSAEGNIPNPEPTPAIADVKTENAAPPTNPPTTNPEKPATNPAPAVKAGRAKVDVKPSIVPTTKVAPSPKISGNTPAKPAPEAGRDANGNPLAVITKKALDWWGRWRMPTLNLWSLDDFADNKKGDNLSRSIPASTAPAPNKSQLERLNLLLKIAEEHTEWVIKEGTAAAVASMVKGTFKQQGKPKGNSISIGACAKYVKIALTEAAITPNTATGLLQFDSASAGGAALLKAGFKDVTGELPDARWAAPGDVVVYRWSASAWANRKTSERWGGSKEKPNPNVPNHGHIDIRSYDNYISDYMPTRRHPTWADYCDIHIYRSAWFDPLPELRMRAFLHCIRDYESQEEKDDAKRFNMLNTALPGSKERRFTGYQSHPWASVEKSKWPQSTAAGPYQILCSTWLELTQGIGGDGKVYLPRQEFFLEKNTEEFSPQLQDRMAVALIDRRPGDPLGDVRNGKIEDAVAKLLAEWTSLPGAKENAKRRTADGKPMDMAYFRTLYEQHLNELLKKKGWK